MERVFCLSLVAALVVRPAPGTTTGNNIALVCMAGSGEVAFIDVDQAQVIANVDLPGPASLPHRIGVSPDGRVAVVSCLTGYISFLDVRQRTAIKTLPLLRGPETAGIPPAPVPNEFGSVRVFPNGQTAVVAEGNEDGQFFFLDMTTMDVDPSFPCANPFDIGDDPCCLYVSATGTEIYSMDEGSITVFDVPNCSTTTFPFPAGTDEVSYFTMTPDETRALFCGEDNQIFLVDTSTWQLLDSDDLRGVFAEPTWIAVSPDGATALMTNATHQSVTFVSVGASSVSLGSTIPLGGSPGGVAFTPRGDKAVIVLANTSEVVVLDIASQTVTPVQGMTGLLPQEVVVVSSLEPKQP